MFRASQANEFDEPVADSSPSGRDVVAAVERRLESQNANTQLYALELANSLVQNCGINVHREISSRHFTDSLLRIANSPATPHQVKANVYERLEAWSGLFSSNSELALMEETYNKLKHQNPNLRAPSKPHKTEITDYDRQREQEDLRMALELSIKDGNPYAAPSSASYGQHSSGYNNDEGANTTSGYGVQGGSATSPTTTDSAAQGSTQPTHAPVSSGTSAATVSRVRALYDFTPSEPGELAFRKGDIIAVLESVFKDWWKGSLRGQTGIFPLNYVEKLTDPTPEELAKEAAMEAEVFGQIKNVEKLLTLLSSSADGGSRADIQDNEEVTKLYHETLAIRPKLIELIGKYSQRKDDFTQLNEKFIKARRDYEALLESSMAQPPQPTTNPFVNQQQARHSSYGYAPVSAQQQSPYQTQPPSGGFSSRPPNQLNPYSSTPSLANPSSVSGPTAAMSQASLSDSPYPPDPIRSGYTGPNVPPAGRGMGRPPYPVDDVSVSASAPTPQSSQIQSYAPYNPGAGNAAGSAGEDPTLFYR
ncbi:ESCRT-0 subunit protein hse1 [Ascosphaera aggregata]|nr:ESCRT-0 subunit protein hse1 [Ascosphaera aggregata]